MNIYTRQQVWHQVCAAAGDFAPPTPLCKNVYSVRETEILLEQ